MRTPVSHFELPSTYLFADSWFFDFAESLQRLEQMWSEEGSTNILQEGSIKCLCHLDQDLLVVVHEVQDVRQQLVPGPLYAERN